MRSALSAGVAVLGVTWPILLWLLNLNGRISSAESVQLEQAKRIERVEHLTDVEFRGMRELLESVDRRLSRIEGKLSRNGSKTWEK